MSHARSRSLDDISRTSSDNYVQDDFKYDIPKHKNTVVSFVMGKEHEEEAMTDGQADRYAWTVLLSVLYSILIVLIGVVYTVNEAINEDWDTSPFVVAYLTYMYVVAIIVLVATHVYLKWHQVTSKKGAKPSGRSDTPMNHANPAYSASEPETLNQITTKRSKDALMLRLRNYDHLKNDSGLPSGVSSVASSGQSSPAMNRTSASAVHDSAFATADNCPPSRKRSVATLVSANGGISMEVELDQNKDADSELSEFNEQIIVMHETASRGHEGTNFYLRLGVLLFGIGSMVFVSLEIRAFTEQKATCKSDQYLFYRYLILTFLVIQTFLLFKNTSIHIKKYKSIARFGWIHVFATNLVFWFRVLVKEIMESYHHHEQDHPQESDEGVYDSLDIQMSRNCNHWVNAPFLHEAAPYLFPFVLEYSLVAVSIQAGIFRSFNLRIQVDVLKSMKRAIIAAKNRQEYSRRSGNDEPFFHRSHTGLYMGVLVLAGTIISIVTLFTYKYSHKDEQNSHAHDIFVWTCLTVHILQLIACCYGLHMFRNLKFTFARDNSIDRIFLLVSWAGLISIVLFVLAAGVAEFHTQELVVWDFNDVLNVLYCIFTIVFTLVQTCFIIDGLERCPKDKDTERIKPGRGAITFLIITNITMWMFESIAMKKVGDETASYYGVLWPVLSNIGVPMQLFYRFHSSVCLADIWHSAYVQEEETHYKVF